MKPEKLPPIEETFAEVFIIESLSIEDERPKVSEGKILFDTLKMCGKDPEYYYIRTRKELEEVAIIFRKSGYRYLHLSCHADESNICLTYDDLTYAEFAEIFKGHLRNRRLFVSACEVGNEIFSTIIAGKGNKGMYSIAAPKIKIAFDKAVALWCAFYVQVFSEKEHAMNSTRIKYALIPLCHLFNVPFLCSIYVPKYDKWKHVKIEGRPMSSEDTLLKKANSVN